jgi:hypothetical protein
MDFVLFCFVLFCFEVFMWKTLEKWTECSIQVVRCLSVRWVCMSVWVCVCLCVCVCVCFFCCFFFSFINIYVGFHYCTSRLVPDWFWFWLLIYTHRHRTILEAVGHILLTLANQLMVKGLKIWSLSPLRVSNQWPFDHWPNALTTCTNRAQYQNQSDPMLPAFSCVSASRIQLSCKRGWGYTGAFRNNRYCLMSYNSCVPILKLAWMRSCRWKLETIIG